MPFISPSRRLAAAFLIMLPVQASAHDFKLGALQIDHPWARATPPGATVGGGYLSIKNTGAEEDRLVAVTTKASEHTEMHKMSMDNDVMSMSPIADGVPIPVGETVVFGPGGLHLMLIELRGSLKQGKEFEGTLVFEKAGPITVTFKIDKIGANTSNTAEHKEH